MTAGRGLFRGVAIVALIAAAGSSARAQYVSRNINMVAGTDYATGDPYLQRQDEPSVSVSTRNAFHVVGGSNDYRTVDIPGLPNGEETGDAWLGVFKSFDGGMTWRSGLIPGYPQDTSPAGLASPLHQTVNGITFTAAADPMVRSGLQGMFYYSGIALTRSSPPVSAVFVARYNDFNDREAADPVRYIGTSIVTDGRNGGLFLDKPALATDLPRPGSQVCSVGGQSIFAGNVYVIYTVISSHLDTNGKTVTDSAKLYASRSVDCGATWSTPVAISGNNTINQGAVAVVDTRTGTLHVVWRRFAKNGETDAIVATKSTDGGKTFSTPIVIRSIVPFEQGTSETSFRTSCYPTAVTDADGRLYVAWAERSGPSGTWTGVSDKPDGRIMFATSSDGATWSSPVMAAPNNARGHQFMPALSYQSGKVMLVYYDLREDSTIGYFTWTPAAPFFIETRSPAGNLAKTPPDTDNVFNNYVQDAGFGTPLLRRHTLDLRAAQASPGALPAFSPSQRVSIYKFGYTSTDPTVRQLEFNPPNLKMFKQGTVPFFGDYVDVAPQFPFIGSILNLPLPAPVFHAVWTDNRDVRPPLDGDWTKYTPPNSPAYPVGSVSRTDGTTILQPCVDASRTGMRNQNIYTSRITAGLFFGSPGNDKPLGRIQRAFVVTVQNSKSTPQSYRLQIANQPIGGKATFQQIPVTAPPLTTLDVTVNGKSSASRSVFVTATVKNPPIGVTVTEIPAPGGTPAPGALVSATVLNADPTSPDIGTPDIGTPDIGTVEVYSPDIGTPDIGTPDIGTPDIGTPDIGTPDIGTPDIGTPDIGTPDIGTPTYATPDIGTPDIGTPDIGTNSVTDTTWPVANDGNTTASYTTKLLQTGQIPPGIKLQLILSQPYALPTTHGCNLATETEHLLLNNVPNPTILTSTTNIGSPDIGTPSASTVSIPPGNAVSLTVRVVDPVHHNRVIPAISFLTPVIVAHAVNTTDLSNPNPQPPIALTITTSIPDAPVGTQYNVQMTAIGGKPPYTFAFDPNQPIGECCIGQLPTGLTFDPQSGTITGTATRTGSNRFVMMVTDSASPAHVARRGYGVNITAPLTLLTASVPPAVVNQPYSAKLASTGGLAPVFWELLSGSLPAGLTLSGDGTISGTPTAVGSSLFRLRVFDSSMPAQTAQSAADIQLDVIPPTGCSSTVTVLFDNWNTDGVSNGGTTPTISTNGQWYCFDSASDYHWNNGNGQTPGKIGLTESYRGQSRSFGPFAAVGSSGQGNAPNVNWTAQGPIRAPAILRPGATYTVDDSDPATWSQNAKSNNKGFTRIFVRTYTPPTVTVVAHLVYNGSPAKPSTTPSIFVLNNDTNTVVNPANVVWDGNTTVTMTGLVPGNYGIEVSSQEGATALFAPGSFYGFAIFDSIVASDTGVNVTLTRIIHTTSPIDNQPTQPAIGCPPSTSIASVTGISVDAIEIPATYRYDIEKFTCGNPAGRPVLNGTMDGTSVSFAELAPTGPGEYYTITVNAFTPSGIFVGQVMSNYANGHGWDLRFTVPPKLQFATQPASAISGTTVSADLVVTAKDASGAVVPGVLVTLQQLSPCTATSVATMTATTNSLGEAHFANVAAQRGCYNVRLTATAANFGAGTSTPFDVFGFGDLPQTNDSHAWYSAAVRLNDGRILVTGGGADPATPVNTAEVYSPKTNTWVRVGNMAFARLGHTATLLADGTVLIAGGLSGPSSDPASYVTALEIFNPATNTFSTSAFSLAQGRFWHTASLLSNGTVVLVGGGTATASGTNSIEVYTASGVVTLTATLAVGRIQHTATVLSGDRIVVIGGVVNTGSNRNLIEVIINATVFGGGLTQEIREARHVSTVLADGRVLTVGGLVPNPTAHISQTCEIYDPVTQTSTLTPNMLHEHGSAAVQLLSDGTVVIAGGHETSTPCCGAGAIDAVELFDPSANTFTDYGKLSTPQIVLYSVPLDGSPGRFIVIGAREELFFPHR